MRMVAVQVQALVRRTRVLMQRLFLATRVEASKQPMLDVGVDVDMDILRIAPLARFLRSSHNFKPKPEGLVF